MLSERDFYEQLRATVPTPVEELPEPLQGLVRTALAANARRETVVSVRPTSLEDDQFE